MGDETREAKQVICMRTDLNMRKGKMVAQGSHASLGVVLNIQKEILQDGHYGDSWYDAYRQWIDGTFTKICVGVPSEEALLAIQVKAVGSGLPVKLITDAGKTEFGGVPTLTCLAIGPAWAEDIDKITGELKLL